MMFSFKENDFRAPEFLPPLLFNEMGTSNANISLRTHIDRVKYSCSAPNKEIIIGIDVPNSMKTNFLSRSRSLSLLFLPYWQFFFSFHSTVDGSHVVLCMSHLSPLKTNPSYALRSNCVGPYCVFYALCQRHV